jgi:predicted transcriptional regulator
MSDCRDILISLAPAYTRAILDGRKTVELRRRRLCVGKGTRIWIYSKIPAARIEATAYVQQIYENNPDGLWSQFGHTTGISRAEFDRYFMGCSRGCAVVLDNPTALVPALGLSTMKKKIAGFHPPQFFKRLRSEELRALQQSPTSPGGGRKARGGERRPQT